MFLKTFSLLQLCMIIVPGIVPAYVSGCQIKSSPSTYVGLPSTGGSPATPFYGCVGTATNCEYEVHMIGNYESSNGRHGFGIPRVAGDTYVDVNINGRSSKPLVLVFTSYEPVNWRLNLPSEAVVDKILLGGYYTSKVVGYSNTNVEVVPRNVLGYGYGSDGGGGGTTRNIAYLTKRFGPITSFSGSYRADRWTININRSVNKPCNSSISTHQSIMIRFEKVKYVVNEDAGSITVVLLTSGSTVRNFAVQYSTTDGTARAPMDYTAVNQTSIIPAGTTRFEITIPIQNDDTNELSETFEVHLSLPDEPTVVITNTTIEIIDNDRLSSFGCNATCPVNSGKRCIFNNYCSGSYKTTASCDTEGYCRCHKSVLYDGCTCLPHVSGCLIKRSPSAYIGLPSTGSSPETPFYGCVSTATNCEYEVHVIGNYESSNGHHGFGRRRVAGNTYVTVNINGRSSKPLVLVFISYEPVNWRLNLPSGVTVNRIILGGYYTSKIVGYSNSNVEVVPRGVLRSSYGPDDGGGDTAGNIAYLTKRFGPIASFSGSYRANRWNVNINRSPACESLSVQNNQPSIILRFENARYTVSENSENITVALLTNGPYNKNIAVQYLTKDGTARASLDYTAVNQTSIIPAGTTRFEINIPIISDGVREPSETFEIYLSLPDEPTACIPDTTVTIIDSQPLATVGPTTNRPFTNFRPFTNSPSESTAELIGIVVGVVGGILVLIFAVVVVSFLSLKIHARSQTLSTSVMQHTRDGTTLNVNADLPLPTNGFDLQQPQPPASVACKGLTQAPPPAYNLHEEFVTYNENKIPSEAPPPYQPPSYDIATQKTNHNFHQD